MVKLTHERLKEVLSYDPETGIFAWLKPTSPRAMVGSRAGAVSSNGRRYIALDGEKFMAHRLAWFYIHGEWPEGDVKQLNDNFDDCRASNLDDVSRSVASRSRSLDNRNKSGFRGVSQNNRGRWQAFITRNYKQVALGTFDTAEEASAAYELAASEMEPAVSIEDKIAAAESAKMRKRMRVAWAKLNDIEPDHFFIDYEEFVATVKDVPPRHSVVAVAETSAIGPGNWDVVADLSTGFDLSTRDGRIAYNRAHRKANPDVYRDRQLRKDFGIGLADYNRMLEEQGGVCAICHKESSGVVRGELELPFHVDHDHDTMKVRGLLCGGCNPAIGMMCEDIGILQNAITYLRKHAGVDTVLPFEPTRPDRDWLHVATLGFGT